MLKKTITFTDYDGNNRTEDHYFNLSQAETLKLELGEVGGLTKKINRIISSQDIPVIMATFDELIKRSYGVKSPDGREFIKSEEITRSFMQTEAYSKLFVEFCTVEGAAAAFVNGILPNGVNDANNTPENNTKTDNIVNYAAPVNE